MRRSFDAWRYVHALAVLAIGLTAGTALAHVLEMPHKLAMTGAEWLPIQQTIYNGWGPKLFWLNVLAIVALASIIVRFPLARVAAFSSLGMLLIADVVLFVIWIAPTNNALDAWTLPAPMPDWQTLRANWEWGHAARAALLSAATFAACLAAPHRTSTPKDRTRGTAQPA